MSEYFFYFELEKTLNDLQKKLDSINMSDNKVFALLESNVLNLFHEANRNYEFFVNENDIKNVDFLLKQMKISSIHASIVSSYDDIFQKLLYDLSYFGDINTDLDNCDGQYPFCFEQEERNEVLELYAEDKSVFTDYVLFDDVNPFSYHNPYLFFFYDPKVTLVETGKKQAYSSLTKMYNVFCVVSNYINKHYKPNNENYSLIKESLIKDFKDYSKENENITIRDLKRLAQKFKPSRSSILTEEIWGEVMRVEDEIFNITISGDLSSIKEDDYDIFDKYTLQEMVDNYELIQKILNISSDESLFDFKYAFEAHINLLSSLNDNNLQLFYQLVLRRNLIQCEMFPELKAEYREFLKDDNNAEKNTSETACSISLDSLDASVRDYFLMKDKFADIVRVLNETIKPIVDATGNKANWDYVCFAFKLLNIVPRNLSREKFTNLIVAMCPDLGEASRLKSSMEHSGANYKEKFDVYENLSETNSLKSNSRQYVDALKDVL